MKSNNCRIISVALNKGGVGKSTTCINLGVALSNQGHRVLMVDLDPQGHLAACLGRDAGTLKHTIANLMYAHLDGFPVSDDGILVPIYENLDLLPSNKKLTIVGDRLLFAKSQEREDEGAPKSEEILKLVLDGYRDRYEYIIIDCQPNVSILTRNALVASDSVILPVETHYLAYEGLRETLDIIALVKRHYNPGLQIEGILLTKYQSRTNLCSSIKEMVETHYANEIHIFSEPVAYSIKAAEQSAQGTSIFELDDKSNIAKAYLSLAQEVTANG
jgi:chromosome partitioning protein